MPRRTYRRNFLAMKRTFAVVGTVLACLIFFAFHIAQTSWRVSSSSRTPAVERPKVFPRKVWQTWQGSKKLEDEPLRLARTWVELNPGYGYELLTDSTAETYIRRAFPNDVDLLDTWAKINDYILRADLIRYLAMLGDGGIYSDMDTDCTRPIVDWLPRELEEAADIVVGIEYDERADPLREDMSEAAQFCTWTIMAKPGSRHMQNVVDDTLNKLRAATRNESIHADNATEVLRLTGPRVSGGVRPH